MPTDTGITREVRWTKSAQDDLTFWKFTFGEWRAIRSEVERIAKLRHLCLDSAVCRVEQCDGEWMRLKLTTPSQIRVFFSEEKHPPRIIIQAVMHRSSRTYDIAQILWKVA